MQMASLHGVKSKCEEEVEQMASLDARRRWNRLDISRVGQPLLRALP